MATYVNDLRLKEIATGDEAGTWGTSTNTNLELIAEAFSFGTEAITTNANTHTTTIADGSTDPGRSIFLKYTGALDSDCTITIGPNTVSKLWLIENATTDSGSSGPYNIIIKQGTGATVTIPNSHTKAIYSDGAGSGGAMVEAFTDLNLTDTVTISGSTPTLTIGDAGAEDTKIVFDGNAQDFYIGLDDSADDLVIGKGSAVGTTPAIEIDENLDIKFAESIGVGQAASSTTGDIVAQTMSLKGTTPTLTIGDAGAEDTKIVFDGNAQDYHIGLDDSSDDLVIGTGSTLGTNAIVSIDHAGKVGINRTTMNATLHIGAATPVFRMTDSDNDGSAQIVGVDGSLRFDADNEDAQSDTTISFKIDNSEKARITSGGTVLVGKTALDNSTAGIRLNASGQATFARNGSLLYLNRNTTDGDLIEFAKDNSLVGTIGIDGSALTFDTGGSEKMKLNSDGKLAVTEISHITSGNLEIGNGDEKQIFDASDAAIKFQTADTERARINSAGVLCIGTTGAGSSGALNVVGSADNANVGAARIQTSDINGASDLGCTAMSVVKTVNNDTTSNVFIRFGINGFGGGSGQINANGSSQAAFGTFSDRRLKENITDLPSQLDKIKAMRPVEFDYIESEGGGHQLGFVAQEIEEIYPDMVGERHDGMKTLSTLGRWEARLVKAIQEQQEQIEALQSEINTLKGE